MEVDRAIGNLNGQVMAYLCSTPLLGRALLARNHGRIDKLYIDIVIKEPELPHSVLTNVM